MRMHCIEVSLYRTVYCSLNGVLNIEVSLYRTVYCNPNGVLNIEVSLYRTVYCNPNGVLNIEVSLYGIMYCHVLCILCIFLTLLVLNHSFIDNCTFASYESEGSCVSSCPEGLIADHNLRVCRNTTSECVYNICMYM